jgi:hypothetical protein
MPVNRKTLPKEGLWLEADLVNEYLPGGIQLTEL